jgi:hypothetical protein
MHNVTLWCVCVSILQWILTHICGYANDILVTARSLPALEGLCIELSREAGGVGLVVSPDKTKYMKFSASPSRRSVKGATINGVTYEEVTEFIYLDMLISNDNSVQKEIQRRILAGRFECAVGSVRHPQHTQTGSNSSTIAADSSNGVTNTRCCRYSCMRS